MKTRNRLAVGMAMLILAAGGAQTRTAAADDAGAPKVLEIRKLFVQGRYAEGVKAVRAESVKQPANEDLQYMQAMVAMDTGDYAEAFRIYSAVLERFPDNAGLKNNIAWIRLKSADPAIHDLDKALREAQEAILANPRDYNIWNTLGELYLARGDVMRAMRLATLARDMAALAGEPDLRVYRDLVQRCENAPEKGK